jgi:hypothetical protein
MFKKQSNADITEEIVDGAAYSRPDLQFRK